jgi:dihydrofolate synthase/folylpolyglutamate synthase
VAEADGALVALFRELAASIDVPLHELDPARDPTDVEVERDHTSFTLATPTWGLLRLRTPLVGRHQAVNAALAVRLLEHLPVDLRPSSRAVLDGVAAVCWPGRDQIEVVDGTTWMFDVAHNTAGVQSLVQVLDRVALPRPAVGLIGVLGDKDWGAMLPPLLERLDAAVLTQPPSAPASRRWNPRAARRAVEGVDQGSQRCPLEVEPEFAAAIERVQERAGGGTVVVTGSCHTVGDALAALDRVPFRNGSA